MRTEKEITGKWKDKDTIVSICCVTFNQEDFIEETLKSFLMQETSCSFEILIHDDASTDKTSDIIKYYEKKYPSIIKPIYQTENQFSKGKLVNLEYNLSRIKGKYIALCDGDDYWCDTSKLHKQVDFLENNFEYIGCSHNTEILRDNSKSKELVVNNPLKDIFTIDDFSKGEIYFHTSSMMYRFDKNKDKILKYLELHRGDWYISMIFAQFGPIKYIDEVMSVYRIHDKGVWSLLSTKEQVKKNLKAIIDFNNIFENKYKNNFLNLFLRVSKDGYMKYRDEFLFEIFNDISKKDTIKVINYAYDYTISKDNILEQKSQEIEQKTQEIEQKTQEIEQKTQEIEQKNQEIEQKNQEIEQKNQEIEQKNQEIEQKSQEIEQKSQEITKKNEIIQKNNIFLDELYLSKSWKVIQFLRKSKYIILKKLKLK